LARKQDITASESPIFLLALIPKSNVNIYVTKSLYSLANAP
jgi:hypothetical protein